MKVDSIDQLSSTNDKDGRETTLLMMIMGVGAGGLEVGALVYYRYNYPIGVIHGT